MEKKDKTLPVALQLSTERDQSKNLAIDGTDIANSTTWETTEHQDN